MFRSAQDRRGTSTRVRGLFFLSWVVVDFGVKVVFIVCLKVVLEVGQLVLSRIKMRLLLLLLLSLLLLSRRGARGRSITRGSSASS
jgi:hypothetical protein